MTAHRIVWSAAVGILLTRGLVLGLGQSPVLVAATFLLGAAAGAAIWSVRHRERRFGPAALVSGAVTAGAVGLVPSLGAGLLLIGLLALATAPDFLAATDRWVTSAPSRSTSRWDALVRGLARAMPGYVPASRLSELTDEQLWEGWQDTEAALLRPALADQTLAVVELREAYLDELESRDPAVFAARLGAEQSSDWDDLIRRLDT